MRASKAIDSKTHMCDFCKLEYPECNPVLLEFGDGIGMDNVVVCSSYITKKISGDKEIELAPERGIF